MLRAQSPTKAPQLLASSGVAVSHTGNTNETALATVTVPAGAMGTNGAIEIQAAWTIPNNANIKTARIRFGGTSGTVYMSSAQTTVATISDIRRIRNRGAANSQVGNYATTVGGLGTAGAAIVTSAVDTSASVDLVISGQVASAADTITLETYEVWLIPG